MDWIGVAYVFGEYAASGDWVTNWINVERTMGEIFISMGRIGAFSAAVDDNPVGS